jgi:F0F1-type ATP synthase assembly protein I
MNEIKQKTIELEQRINKLKSETIEKKLTETKGLTGEKVLAEMIAGLAFGFITGWLIDGYFNTKPIFLLTMIILGLAGSIYNIYKESQN